MGADQFIEIGEGKTAAEAFSALTGQARYEHGHGGYSGTIAEKTEFVTVGLPPALESAPEVVLRAYVETAMYGGAAARDAGMERMLKLVEDKWGPAGHVALGGSRHLFFGWASS